MIAPNKTQGTVLRLGRQHHHETVMHREQRERMNEHREHDERYASLNPPYSPSRAIIGAA